MKDNKLLVPLTQLKPWRRNPRTVKREDYERTKRMVQKLGSFKPLIVSTKAFPQIEVEVDTILGGKTRYHIYKDLNYEKAWVEYVSPKNADEALEYVFADNDDAGTYIDEEVALLVRDTKIDLEDYKIHLGEPVDLKKLIDSFGPLQTDLDTTPPGPKQKQPITCPECGAEFYRNG